MRAFFTIIFGALAIIVLALIMYVGFKSLLGRALRRIKAFFGFAGNDTEQSQADAAMKTVNITTGQCQNCGRTWVGTTADTDTPLTEVEFMGEKRILCAECLAKLKAEFDHSGESSEKKYTRSAKNLGEMLDDMRNHF